LPNAANDLSKDQIYSLVIDSLRDTIAKMIEEMRHDDA